MIHKQVLRYSYPDVFHLPWRNRHEMVESVDLNSVVVLLRYNRADAQFARPVTQLVFRRTDTCCNASWLIISRLTPERERFSKRTPAKVIHCSPVMWPSKRKALTVSSCRLVRFPHPAHDLWSVKDVGVRVKTDECNVCICDVFGSSRIWNVKHGRVVNLSCGLRSFRPHLPAHLLSYQVHLRLTEVQTMGCFNPSREWHLCFSLM